MQNANAIPDSSVLQPAQVKGHDIHLIASLRERLCIPHDSVVALVEGVRDHANSQISAFSGCLLLVLLKTYVPDAVNKTFAILNLDAIRPGPLRGH